jgi:hypothetical protein
MVFYRLRKPPIILVDELAQTNLKQVEKLIVTRLNTTIK